MRHINVSVNMSEDKSSDQVISELPDMADAVSGSRMSYRATALIATVTCVIGALLFFLYDERSILAKIDNLKKVK